MSRDSYPFSILEDPEFREDFGQCVYEFVQASRARDKKVKEDAEISQKKYGIKYCPFHRLGLIGEVEPDVATIEFYRQNYKFTSVECATDTLCHSNISFDKGLIEKIKSEEQLIEMQTEDFTRCVTCGSDKGRTYFTGFHISISRIGNRKGKAIKLEHRGIFLGKEKLYLFERPCHTYLVANFGGLNLKTKKFSEQKLKL